MKYLLFLLLVSGTIVTNAQHSVWGIVIDKSGEPLPGATIVLNTELYYTTSGSEGVFRIDNVLAGTYEIKISFIGHKTYIDSITVEGNIREVLVYLEASLEMLQEVEISDHHIDRKRKETALNIEVVNQQFLLQNRGTNLVKSLERLPGVSAISIGSGQAKPVLRGLSFNRLVVAENGLKHQAQQWGADHGLEIDQYAIDEVDVIKGPASLMYGSDAIGGVINITNIQVPQKQSLCGDVDLNYKSNNDSYGVSLNLKGRKDKSWFDARFTYIDYGDYRVPTDHISVYSYIVPLKDRRLRNTAGNELNMHITGGYVGKSFSSSLTVSSVSAKSGFFANAHGLEPRSVDEETHDASHRDILKPYQDVQHLKVVNRNVIFLENHQLEIQLGYQNNDRNEWSDYVSHGYMPPVYPESMAIPYDLERHFNKDIWSLNAFDEMKFGKHQITAGLNTEYQDNRIGGWGFIIPAFQQYSSGLFVYDKITLNEKLILHAGLRYDHGSIDIDEYYDWYPDYLQRAQNMHRSFNNLSGAIGLNYNLEHFSLKANAGKSFRMPTAQELGSNGVNYHMFSYHKGDSDLTHEESYQLDLSVEWHHEKWAVQLSPFVNYFPNYIYLNPTAEFDYLYGAGNQVYYYTQAEVMRFGGEIHAHYSFTDQLRTGLIGEYLYAEQLSGDKKGFGLPFAPAPSLLLNVSYSSLKNTKWFAYPYAKVDYRITAEQNRIVPPEKITEGYQLVNLSMGTKLKWGDQLLDLNIQVQNLFNQKYYNHTSFYRLIDVPEPGRNFIVSLKIPFSFTNH